MPRSAHDVAKMRELLEKKLGYDPKQIFSNMSSADARKENPKASCKAKDIIDYLETMLNVAKFADKYKNPVPFPLHFFIFWSG